MCVHLRWFSIKVAFDRCTQKANTHLEKERRFFVHTCEFTVSKSHEEYNVVTAKIGMQEFQGVNVYKFECAPFLCVYVAACEFVSAVRINAENKILASAPHLVFHKVIKLTQKNRLQNTSNQNAFSSFFGRTNDSFTHCWRKWYSITFQMKFHSKCEISFGRINSQTIWLKNYTRTQRKRARVPTSFVFHFPRRWKEYSKFAKMAWFNTQKETEFDFEPLKRLPFSHSLRFSLLWPRCCFDRSHTQFFLIMQSRSDISMDFHHFSHKDFTFRKYIDFVPTFCRNHLYGFWFDVSFLLAELISLKSKLYN